MPEKIKVSDLEEVTGGQKKSRPRPKRTNYICKQCGKNIMSEKMPNGCPYCLGKELEPAQ